MACPWYPLAVSGSGRDSGAECATLGSVLPHQQPAPYLSSSSCNDLDNGEECVSPGSV